ncbi:type II CAAX endopeptidase family protein [Tissierella sp.]|uniref:CPBP family intramembrane glutamic endopeptidase n=1 Tax=Tissierella sp. TaxID=41274 RepID=UPI0028623746|nr:type II CAAX endopeptidase family protein [Tissierella sp.]MDR7857871.1 type II CAAX endopeptidase family protein [Tissierella sp.]
MSSNTISIITTIYWIVTYLIICGIIPAALDKLIWRTFENKTSVWLNLLTLIAVNTIFLLTLIKKYQLKVSVLSSISMKGVLLAFACAILFYLLLDKFLDPFFDNIFVTSADEYRRTISELSRSPMVNFIRICLLAPVVEEILIRGIILSSLQNRYGAIFALLASTLLFAVLHFNFVQTLSAIICGLVLGLLYINTGSLFTCILAHSLYNTISFFTSILIGKQKSI